MPLSDRRERPGVNLSNSRFEWNDGDIRFVGIEKTKAKKKKPPMKLTTEGGIKRHHPSASVVLSVLSELDTGKGNSFCGLESTVGNYVQALHGLNGWHLEWRETDPHDQGAYRHYRAAKMVGANRKRLLRKSDKFVSRGLERDILNAEDVRLGFLAFLRSEARPKQLKWRRLKI